MQTRLEREKTNWKKGFCLDLDRKVENYKVKKEKSQQQQKITEW